MPRYIIHHAGTYNVFSTVVDSPIFDSGLTLEQLTYHIKEEYGNRELESLPCRLDRAHDTGCSGYNWTIHDCVEVMNQSFNTEYTVGQFIEKFLVIKDDNR